MWYIIDMDKTMKLIGGQKLRELGSDRHTDDEDYLIYDAADDRLFIREPGRDIVNAASHPFYAQVWAMDADSPEVSLQALLEMTVFTFVQHCENGQWDKADAKEYDLKFLVRKIGTTETNYPIARQYIGFGAQVEVDKIIKSVKIYR
jgi:hypothetical protein